MQGIFLTFFLGLVLAVCEIAVIPFLVSHREIGLVIPCLVLLLVRTPLMYALTFIITVGILLDSYALYGFEAHTFRLLFLLGVSWFVFTRWLTNKSIYTALVLSLLATCLDVLLALLLNLGQGVSLAVAWSSKGFFLALVVHGLCSFVAFSLLNLLSPRTRRFSVSRDRSSSYYG